MNTWSFFPVRTASDVDALFLQPCLYVANTRQREFPERRRICRTKRPGDLFQCVYVCVCVC